LSLAAFAAHGCAGNRSHDDRAGLIGHWRTGPHPSEWGEVTEELRVRSDTLEFVLIPHEVDEADREEVVVGGPYVLKDGLILVGELNKHDLIKFKLVDKETLVLWRDGKEWRLTRVP
jgi:hypothetical protein